MDRSNLSDVERWRKRKSAGEKARIMLFGEFSGSGRKEVVQDPYYGGVDGFEAAYEQCRRFAINFLATTFPDIPPPK